MNTYVEFVPAVLGNVDIERPKLPQYVEGAAANADDEVGEGHAHLCAGICKGTNEDRTKKAQNGFDVCAEEEGEEIAVSNSDSALEAVVRSVLRE